MHKRAFLGKHLSGEEKLARVEKSQWGWDFEVGKRGIAIQSGSRL